MAFVLVQFFFEIIEHTLLLKKEKMLLLLRGTSFFVVLDVLLKAVLRPSLDLILPWHVIHNRAYWLH